MVKAIISDNELLHNGSDGANVKHFNIKVRPSFWCSYMMCGQKSITVVHCVVGRRWQFLGDDSLSRSDSTKSWISTKKLDRDYPEDFEEHFDPGQ